MRCTDRNCQKEISRNATSCPFCHAGVQLVQPFALPNAIRGIALNTNIVPYGNNVKPGVQKFLAASSIYGLPTYYARIARDYYFDQNVVALANPQNGDDLISIIRRAILNADPALGVGRQPLPIYALANICGNGAIQKAYAINAFLNRGWAGTPLAAGAIWQVGRGDGVYLEILEMSGSGTVKVADWAFLRNWL